MDNFNVTECKSIEDLTKRISSLNLAVNIEDIQKAFLFAQNSHKNTKRIGGEDWIVHCLNVAAYLAELRLDTTSIVAGLIHDTVEKEGVKIDDIDNEFGTEVAFIVDGLTKIRTFSKHVTDIKPDEDFNELIFQSAEDIRIIIIRLCEKLHNLTTVESLSAEQQQTIASKSLYIYAPLAEFLGLGALQKELQDRSFQILHPKRSELISSFIHRFYKETDDLIRAFEEEFKALMNKYNVGFIGLKARQKGIYSTYMKVKKKYLQEERSLEEIEKALHNVKDIYAARVIVKTIEDCYVVLGLVHANYETLHEEFVDYIAKPKENGYKSVHTLFKYKDITLEVQIRTQEMHDFNEFGPASHIAYKLGNLNTAPLHTWTKDLLKWQGKKELTKEDFKVKVLRDSLFCFTPKGEVKSIPKGSTPIDFAFRVHTDLGSHYQGALVNGKMVSMDHQLQTGDVVEIITTNKVNVSSNWLKYSKSSSNRSRIKRILKNKELDKQ